MKSLPVYIGYDNREDAAYRVCVRSLLNHASIDLKLTKLDIDRLHYDGIYKRTFIFRDGQTVDNIDERPFSTWFAFTRFLVPHLMEYKGWAIFCDCDFLFTADIAELIPLLDDSKAVMVVKHNHIPSEYVKMAGQSQAVYPRKNWSSFIAWNCSHPSNKNASPWNVNTRTGRWLHGFSWLRNYEIGELPKTWNWLSGFDEPLDEIPKAIHFTSGTPDMKGHENAPYADLWRRELTRSAQKETTS